MKKQGFKPAAIAPCGINCARCRAHLRPNNPCPGCNNVGPKSRKRQLCRLRNCAKRKGRFCFRCKEFPCPILSHLDTRYRTKYGMSEIENLEFIRNFGIRRFIAKEEDEAISEKGILCIHDKRHYKLAEAD